MNSLIKDALNKAGFVIRRKQPWMNNYDWLHQLNINTIIDVGANEGQFATEMRIIFPYAKIFSFEPIKKVFEKLELNLSKDKNIHLYNLGLGDIESTFEINVNDFSASSSLLDLDTIHLENYKHATKTHKEEIKISTLDLVINQDEMKKNTLIKVDVQGYEDKVILGGVENFKSAKIAIIETSFKSLYKNQKLFEDIYQLMFDLGFRYKGNFGESYYNNSTGEVLFSDSIFINTKL